MLWIESRMCSTIAGSCVNVKIRPLGQSGVCTTGKLTASFFAATPATSLFVSRGTRESVSKNRNDLKLYRYQATSAVYHGHNHTFNLPLNSFHATLPSEPRSGIRKCSAEHSDRIIYSAWISVQNFLCDKGPMIYFLGNLAWQSSTSFMRHVHVTRVVCMLIRGARWLGEWGQ